MIHPKGHTLTCLAGLYRLEQSGSLKYPVFSILTREPGESIRFIHDRMPLILLRRSRPGLDPAGRRPEGAHKIRPDRHELRTGFQLNPTHRPARISRRECREISRYLHMN